MQRAIRDTSAGKILSYITIFNYFAAKTSQCMNIQVIDIELLELKGLVKTRKTEGRQYLFDSIRSKYVKADPEEWVRQLLILYLTRSCAYPEGRISVEKMFIINKINKRFDVLVYDESAKPLVIIECKSPHVKLTPRTLNQVMTYNIKMNAPYIIISNGIDTMMGRVNFEEKSYLWFSKILNYKDLT